MYDQVGEDGMKGGGGGGGPQQGGGPQRGGPQHGGQGGFPHGFPGGGGGGFDFNFGGGGGFGDPFAQFRQQFGGGGGGGGGPKPPSQPLYKGPDASDVIKLTGKTFNSIASRSARGNKIIVLQLYTPASQEAQTLAPTIARLATALKGAVTFAVVDCSLYPRICATYKSENALKILHAEGAKDFDTQALIQRIRNNGGGGGDLLKSGKPLWDAATDFIHSKVGVLSGSRTSIAKIARRCAAKPIPTTAQQQQQQQQPTKRQTSGCVLVFSSKSQVNPIFSALAAMPEFDANANMTTASGTSAGSTTKLPAFYFYHVHVPTVAGASSAEVALGDSQATGALDLGVKTLPAILILHGETLDEMSLGAPLTIEDIVAKRATATDGAIRGRSILPQSESKTAAAMAKWLVTYQKQLAKGLEKST